VAYDPLLTSFILVGLVGGVAVVLSAAPGWESSHELTRATDDWTVPVVSRTYGDDARARQRLRREHAILESHGYRVALRREAAAAATQDVAPATGAGADRERGGPRREIVVTYRLP